MIIRKSPEEIDADGRRRATSSCARCACSSGMIRAGRDDRRARRRRREVHPLAGRRADLQGLPRLPRLDLRLAQLDGRARHPRPLRARARRHDLARRRRHARRLGRRRRPHVPGRLAGRARAEAPRRHRARRSSPASSSAVAGNRLGDVSHAIQAAVEARGLAIVRTLVGHGVGRDMHEDPQIPNYGEPGTGPELEEGMVLAIEPMTTAGGPGGARRQRRLGDLLAGRIAGRALRVHGRDHRRRAASPDAVAPSRRRRRAAVGNITRSRSGRADPGLLCAIRGR